MRSTYDIDLVLLCATNQKRGKPHAIIAPQIDLTLQSRTSSGRMAELSARKRSSAATICAKENAPQSTFCPNSAMLAPSSTASKGPCLCSHACVQGQPDSLQTHARVAYPTTLEACSSAKAFRNHRPRRSLLPGFQTDDIHVTENMLVQSSANQLFTFSPRIGCDLQYTHRV